MAQAVRLTFGPKDKKGALAGNPTQCDGLERISGILCRSTYAHTRD